MTEYKLYELVLWKRWINESTFDQIKVVLCNWEYVRRLIVEIKLFFNLLKNFIFARHVLHVKMSNITVSLTFAQHNSIVNKYNFILSICEQCDAFRISHASEVQKTERYFEKFQVRINIVPPTNNYWTAINNMISSFLCFFFQLQRKNKFI